MLILLLSIIYIDYRYVCWSAYLLKKHTKLGSKLGSSEAELGVALDYTAKLPLDQKVYFQYYVQDDTDDGVLMNTKIKIKEVRKFKVFKERLINRKKSLINF